MLNSKESVGNSLQAIWTEHKLPSSLPPSTSPSSPSLTLLPSCHYAQGNKGKIPKFSLSKFRLILSSISPSSLFCRFLQSINCSWLWSFYFILGHLYCPKSFDTTATALDPLKVFHSSFFVSVWSGRCENTIHCVDVAARPFSEEDCTMYIMICLRCLWHSSSLATIL